MHLTPFITLFSRYQYTRALEGFVSPGDGYNRRFADTVEVFQHMKRCIDDTIFYDESLKIALGRTIYSLIRVGRAGTVLNPEKSKSLKI